MSKSKSKREITNYELRIEENWGCSSAGRASALHAEGQEFDPPHLHQEWAHSSGG